MFTKTILFKKQTLIPRQWFVWDWSMASCIMIRLLFVGHLCLRDTISNILEAKLDRDPKEKHRFILTFDGVSVFQWFSLKLCGIHMKTVIGARDTKKSPAIAEEND